MTSKTSFQNTGIVSVDPLVTYTKRHLPTPIGISGACIDLFRDRKSLHFVAPAWVYNGADIEDIVGHLQDAKQSLPYALIVFLASTEYEMLKLSEAGVPTIGCNVGMFVDEKIFRPLPPLDFKHAEFDAVYNARVQPYKRHHLAADIQKLALIWDRHFDGTHSPHESEMKATLPNAAYLNIEHGSGQHRILAAAEVASELAKARCGLCLSAEEGIMRASMEYLMCGLPIVTTRSIGGRDRYYGEPYVVYADDTSKAVAAAVKELNARALSKVAIRDHIGRIVEFERRNFLRLANQLAVAHFGIATLFSSCRPFIECFPFIEPLSEWGRDRLFPLANELGRDLPAKPGNFI